MAMSPYEQLTNMNRGMPEVAPAPTATQMQPSQPSLRNMMNQQQRAQNQGMRQQQRAQNQAMRQQGPGQGVPGQPGMGPQQLQDYKGPMGQPGMEMNPYQQQALQQQMQQQGLQPGMGGIPYQHMETQNTPQYMATYDPSPFSSAQPMGGGLGQQSPMMPQAGLGALASNMGGLGQPLQPMGGGFGQPLQPMGGGLGQPLQPMGGGLGQTPTPMNGGFGQPIGGGAKNAFS